MIVKDNVQIAELVKRIFRETYGVEDDELYHNAELCEKIRNAVKILRGSYKPTDRNSDCDSFYSDLDVRNAYMIAYYPYYIEPVRYVLENFVCFPYDPINLLFFACGPCPELLGTLLAVRDENIHQKIFVNTYDAESNWYREQHITYKLCEEIFLIECWTFYYNFFVGDSLYFHYNIGKPRRKIYFLQNYLSHIPDTPEAVENFLSWFQKLCYDTSDCDYFVLIDLNYNSTATVFRRLVDEDFLEANDLEKIAAHIPDDGEPLIIRHGDTTQALRDNIFTDTFEGGGSLIQKKRTNFYFVVLRNNELQKIFGGD